MGNSFEEKSPTVKLAIWCPLPTAARISAAIFRISDPISCLAMVDSPRRGADPLRRARGLSLGATGRRSLGHHLARPCGHPGPGFESVLKLQPRPPQAA